MDYIVSYYLTTNQVNVAAQWLKSLRDPIARAKIIMRISRFEKGNFGDAKSLREGVSEMRVDEGPGYRVYSAIADQQVVLLLCGGDKTTQDADIEHAIRYWKDWKKRQKNDPAKAK